MKVKDLLVSIVMVAIIILIIVGAPSFVIDILLAINIAVSVVILLNTVYTTDTLELSIFPSLLLVTTLFRLALNVSTSRLILATGDPGDVVTAFGTFVTGGNMIVGFIVFLIITLVQFLVIVKGCERVSEVAARFTLDAMPGKQMAIDADLNSGLINEDEAKARRKKVQRESDFFGAMDGATKFVKGDSIAGIIIIVINLLGGIILGYIREPGADIMTVLSFYANLTVGDGLVSQIPALLISVATGVIVTRAAAEGSLSTDLIAQLFQNPLVLFVTSGVSLALGLMPGLPFLPFVAISGGFLFIGFNLRRSIEKTQVEEEIQVQESEVEEIRKPENVISLLQVDPIELEFGYGIIPLADVNQGGDLLDRVVMIRRQIALELGMIVPIIRLRDNIQLAPNEYVIKIKGVEVSKSELMFDHYMAMNPGNIEEEIDGIPTIEPAFGLQSMWINATQRERAEMLGYTVVDPPSIIATHLTEVVKRHAHELISRQDVQTLLDNAKENNPALVDELVPKMMSIGEVQKVLANLLREAVSIRDLISILESLADYIPITRDPDMLTEYVRQSISRSISAKYVNNNKLTVITVDASTEQTILDSVQQTEQGPYITLEPSIVENLVGSTYQQIQKLLSNGQQPIVLTSPMVRMYFRKLVENAIAGIVVLSYNELSPNTEVQSVGMVSI